MARGHRGGYGFSSSGCAYCSEPITLVGNHWKSAKTDAIFALEIVAIIVLLVCLGLTVNFKWTQRHGSKDTRRTAGYLFATISAIMYDPLRFEFKSANI